MGINISNAPILRIIVGISTGSVELKLCMEISGSCGGGIWRLRGMRKNRILPMSDAKDCTAC
jgi:hypothetical protein